jgi:hypothetical protein
VIDPSRRHDRFRNSPRGAWGLAVLLLLGAGLLTCSAGEAGGERSVSWLAVLAGITLVGWVMLRQEAISLGLSTRNPKLDSLGLSGACVYR